MEGDKKPVVLSGAILCSLGLMVFAFFIHHNFPVRFISFASLLVPAYIISRNLRSLPDLKKISDENVSFKAIILFTIFGIVLGLGLAVRYRLYLNIGIFPKSFHLFILAAAFIGCMEELVFRGFIQGHLKSINGPFSILFGTLSHTGYKCCLFLSPVITTDINIGFLTFWTFIAGILFGITRHLSKSLLPALSAHALFDILVYADYVGAPWWVW